jgi:hypothetical protein
MVCFPRPVGDTSTLGLNKQADLYASQRPYSKIADENQRFSLAQNVANNYKRSDPVGYAKWLTMLNLPAEKLKFLPK